jgi:hypothetical protein
LHESIKTQGSRCDLQYSVKKYAPFFIICKTNSFLNKYFTQI